MHLRSKAVDRMEYVSVRLVGRVQDTETINHPIKCFSHPHSDFPKRELEKRNMNIHPNQSPINSTLPIQIRHLPENIQYLGNIRAAEQVVRRMKVKRDRAAPLVEILNARCATPSASFCADETDSFEDSHFGSRVRGGRRRATEDYDVGVPAKVSAKGCIGPSAQAGVCCVG